MGLLDWEKLRGGNVYDREKELEMEEKKGGWENRKE